MDLKRWECGVPGKEKTLWEGGLFKLEVTFPDGAFPPPCVPTNIILYRSCKLNIYQSTPPNRQNAASLPLSFTPTSTPPAQSAYLS